MSTVPSGKADEPDMALEVRDLVAGYGKIEVLHGVSLGAPKNGVTALIGANGAGKTTLLRAVAGLLPATRGSVQLYGQEMNGLPVIEKVRRGMCLVPEGRGVFPGLSVADNLRLAVPPWESRTRVDLGFEKFPILKQFARRPAGTMSGGQQQMLALARVFLANPRVAMLDEISIGLAPIIVDEIFGALSELAHAGIALVVVEQYVTRVLALADMVHVLSQGTVAFSGRASEIDADMLTKTYLGLGTASPPDRV